MEVAILADTVHPLERFSEPTALTVFLIEEADKVVAWFYPTAERAQWRKLTFQVGACSVNLSSVADGADIWPQVEAWIEAEGFEVCPDSEQFHRNQRHQLTIWPKESETL